MITLRKNTDRRVRKGHLWIFSNEIAIPPVSDLEPGSVHELTDASGEFLGMVYANPHSLIAARILSHRRRAIDGEFFRERLQAAVDRRNRLRPQRIMRRIVFGESDLLAGLVVDQYGTVLVVQSLTAGMDRHLDLVLEVLVDMLSPTGIYLRNDSHFRSLEGMPQEKRLAYGEVPPLLMISADGVNHLVDVANGQKTGMYLDQEWNRSLIAQYVPAGARVLDLFSYTGSWGLHAAAAGAGEVVAVDSSQPALHIAEETARLNGFQARFHTVKTTALDFLKKTEGGWDAIVLDPPAFIKSRSHVNEGIKGYVDVNRRASGKLKSGGILITCSCSHHLDAASFEAMLATASRQSGRELRLLDCRTQGPDHPMLLSMPETRYLKVLVAQSVGP